MTMLHQWFRFEYRLGFAEKGEACTGCKRQFKLNESIMVMRYQRESDGKFGPPVERWHEICYDLLIVPRYGRDVAPRVGPGGGYMVRDDRTNRPHDEQRRRFTRGDANWKV